MKKKLIIFIIFSFILSTIGMPISLHYCEMQKSTSLSDCEMCALESKENSCCGEVDYHQLQLKSDDSDKCCSTRLIEAKVKDNFLSVFPELKIDVKNLVSVLADDNVYPPIDSKIVFLTFTDSSPPLCSNNIYLLNSTFLI